MFKLIVLLVGLFFIVSFVMESIRRIVLLAIRRNSAVKETPAASSAEVMSELHELRKELAALRAEKHARKEIEQVR